MNDALSRMGVVAPDIKLDVVSVSDLGDGPLHQRVVTLLRRVRVASASADVIHVAAFLPLFPLIWILVRKKPVILGPNITGSAFPKRFLNSQALRALAVELPGYWRRWYLGGGALREQMYVGLGRGAGRVIALSGYAAEIIASRGMERERISVMPFAAPLANADLPPVPNIRDYPRPLIAYIGRLDRRKGFDLFLSIVERFERDACFLVVGDGLLRPQLEEAAKRDPRLVSLGRLTRVEVLALLPHIDVYFQPSTYEAVATTVLEALRAGIPVLSADIPSHREIAEMGGVTLFPSGDIEAATKGLCKVLDKPQDQRSDAAIVASELEVDNAARWLASIYRDLVCSVKS